MKKIAILIVFVIVKIFADSINLEGAMIEDFSSYEKFLKKEAEKQYKQILQEEMKKRGVAVLEEDYKKIVEQTKSKVESYVNENLRSMYKAYQDLGGLYVNPIDIRNQLNEELKKEIGGAIDQQLNVTIKDFIGKTYAWGLCCCTPYINKNINEISKFFLPKIKKETVLIGEIEKVLKNIVEKNEKDKLGNSESWKEGILGVALKSQLSELYYTNQTEQTFNLLQSNKFNTLKSIINFNNTLIEEKKIKGAL